MSRNSSHGKGGNGLAVVTLRGDKLEECRLDEGCLGDVTSEWLVVGEDGELAAVLEAVRSGEVSFPVASSDVAILPVYSSTSCRDQRRKANAPVSGFQLGVTLSCKML